MTIKLLIPLLVTSLSMLSPVFAMDSDAVKAHMEKISEQAQERTEETSRLKALEQQVQELEALIRMMLEEKEQKMDG